jgi:hypothetical protein
MIYKHLTNLGNQVSKIIHTNCPGMLQVHTAQKIHTGIYSWSTSNHSHSLETRKYLQQRVATIVVAT